MLASVRSAVLEGVDGRLVRVEVCVSRGLPGYTVVGLPDAAGRESRERVRAALLSSGLTYPQTRVTVNLAPAAVRKSGAGLELAIALRKRARRFFAVKVRAAVENVAPVGVGGAGAAGSCRERRGRRGAVRRSETVTTGEY